MRESLPIEELRSLSRRRGFTLVEIMVATAIMLVVLVVMLQVIVSMTSIWHNSTGSISNFQAARAAFTVINRELARATLKTYVDYINNPALNNPPFGQFRTSLSPALQQTFVPYGFARASELHFICGSAPQIIPSGASAANNPGGAVFFQAPLGAVANADASSDQYLQRALNDVGFYVQYGNLASTAFPSWLAAFFGASPHYRYRLVESVEPTESLSIYQKETATGSYSLSWIAPTSAMSFPVATSTYNQSILAEDVVLLIFRPRLNPVDEQVVATTMGASYGPATQNSIISPNYAYDSRAWQTGYAFSPSQVESSSYAKFMRNQLPPIVDVAMVCVDPNSLARLPVFGQATPPAILQPAGGLFVDSANMDADLAAFGQQLTTNRIRYRIFRSSVQIQGAAWADE